MGSFDKNKPVGDVETFADAYSTALSRMTEYYPEAEIICIIPYNTIYTHINTMGKYCDVIKQVSDYYGAQYVDLRQIGIVSVTDLCEPDYVHPNDKGMEKIAYLIENGEPYRHQQWNTNEDGTFSYYVDGKVLKDSWVKGKDGDKELRYINASGVMEVNQFAFDGAYTYYMMADGSPMKDRMTYHPDGVHLIYFDEYGHEVFSNFQYSSQLGHIYYFDSQGYLYKDEITFWNGGTYYLNGNGQMEQNGWFAFANGRDYGFANRNGTLKNSGFAYDPWGRIVFYHWNGMVARGLITDGKWYYLMDETDGHLVGKFK